MDDERILVVRPPDADIQGYQLQYIDHRAEREDYSGINMHNWICMGSNVN
jgi:hypothetical protein